MSLDRGEGLPTTTTAFARARCSGTQSQAGIPSARTGEAILVGDTVLGGDVVSPDRRRRHVARWRSGRTLAVRSANSPCTRRSMSSTMGRT